MESTEQILQQITKAKETMAVLENDLHNIRLKLKLQPHDPIALRELRQNTRDMTITLNEIEHCHSTLEDGRRQDAERMEER